MEGFSGRCCETRFRGTAHTPSCTAFGTPAFSGFFNHSFSSYFPNLRCDVEFFFVAKLQIFLSILLNTFLLVHCLWPPRFQMASYEEHRAHSHLSFIVHSYLTHSAEVIRAHRAGSPVRLGALYGQTNDSLEQLRLERRGRSQDSRPPRSRSPAYDDEPGAIKHRRQRSRTPLNYPTSTVAGTFPSPAV